MARAVEDGPESFGRAWTGSIRDAAGDQLDRWLRHDLPERFAGRILPVDSAVAQRWGTLRATGGRALPVVDALLAATALEHDLAVVTCNVRDFTGLGPPLVGRWPVTAHL